MMSATRGGRGRGAHGLTVSDADVVAAALEQYRGKARMSFSDCLVLEIPRKAGHLPVGTFDRQVAKLGGAQKL